MNATMKPLTLTAEMALAAILGPKTETRRPLTKKPALDALAVFGPSFLTLPGNADLLPFGPVGTELWLREPGRVVAASYPEYPGGRPGRIKVKYLADNFVTEWMDLPERFSLLPRYTPDDLPSWARKMHGIPNGIFREAARYKAVVLEVRVERLWDITESGARAEGVEFVDGMFSAAEICAMAKIIGCGCDDARATYACLWNSIYGKRPGLAWADNPWVSVTAWDRMVAI